MRWEEWITSMFPIRGWTLGNYDLHTEENWDYNQHTFSMNKGKCNTKMVLHTPKPKYGVYTIGPCKKVLIEHGVPGANFPRHPNQLNSIKVFTRHEIWSNLLRGALSKGLITEPDEQRAQVDLEKSISLSSWFRLVDPWNLLDVMMTRSMIHIDISGESRNVEDRIITDCKAALDPLTTPQGNNILQTYQLCREADTSTGRLKPGKSLFSEGMESCLLFPNDNRALRVLVARTPLQFRELLTNGEKPVVRHHRYQDWMLSGKHLLTAVMSHPWAYEDCIVVSKEAAAKLECLRFKTFSLSDTQAISCNLQPGMKVKAGQILARTMNTEGPTREIIAPEGPLSEVFDVEILKTRVVGLPGYKVHITLMGKYEAVDGTKICTRHGNKGVIRIDPFLPKIKDGRQIEVVISPESILGKRRCFGTLREMAANEKAVAEHKEIIVKHFDRELSIESLLKEGYGQYTELENGRKVFVDPLYWIRTNKHAQDMASVKDGVPVENFKGLVPDKGKIGGQRMGHDVATVLKAKGLANVAEALYGQNVNPAALNMMHELSSCLLGVKYERQDTEIQQDERGVDQVQ